MTSQEEGSSRREDALLLYSWIGEDAIVTRNDVIRMIQAALLSCFIDRRQKVHKLEGLARGQNEQAEWVLLPAQTHDHGRSRKLEPIFRGTPEGMSAARVCSSPSTIDRRCECYCTADCVTVGWEQRRKELEKLQNKLSTPISGLGKKTTTHHLGRSPELILSFLRSR